jgi:hypothetical protein
MQIILAWKKKGKIQNGKWIFWCQSYFKKARFLEFGFKNANLATLFPVTITGLGPLLAISGLWSKSHLHRVDTSTILYRPQFIMTVKWNLPLLRYTFSTHRLWINGIHRVYVKDEQRPCAEHGISTWNYRNESIMTSVLLVNTVVIVHV